MTRRILFTLTLIALTTGLTFAQFNTVGLIGTGSPTGNWDDDTDLAPDVNMEIWTASMTLTTGKVKFRAEDDWTDNWGSDDDNDFPAGTAAPGGGDFNVVSGNYNITFNTTTLDYSFENTAPVYSSVGIIGEGTPSGWDNDTDMTQDPNNPHIWTIELIFAADGKVKFRVDDTWDVNWGGDDFPTGYGVQGGGDIPVTAGEYVITFNSGSGEYTFGGQFPEYSTIGIIGTGSPTGNWDVDTDMVQDAEFSHIWHLDAVQISNGDIKFRAEDDWAVGWGNDDEDEWPSGTASTSGGNIAAQAGEYNITFNHGTGEYSFESTTPIFSSIGIIGTATPNGWDDPDTDMTVNPDNPFEWFLQIELTDGVLKFRADDGWDVSWGNDASDFPTGTATNPGGDITIPAGEYKITFNTATGAYDFAPPITIYSSIGIVGTGTTNGWDGPDIDMIQDLVNADVWTAEVYLNGGVVKFRANDDWVDNWGGDVFPVGSGVSGGGDIPAEAGNWQVTFNSTTGFYVFEAATVGIIGSATPGGWDTDTDMQASGEVSDLWSVTVPLTEAQVKFRRDDDWVVNWGGDDFPAGTGTQDGSDINVTPAGTYVATLNTATGDYSFSPAVGTTNLIDPSTVKLFPNPTTGTLNVSIEAAELQGITKLLIMDATGHVLEVQERNISNMLSLDVSKYTSGMYILQLVNEQYTIGKWFNVSK